MPARKMHDMVDERPKRRLHRIDRVVYSVSGIVVHITVCTEKRKQLFVDPAIAEWVFRSLIHGPVATESDLYAVCVMPDHIHLLLGVKETNIIDLLGRWKSFVVQQLSNRTTCNTIWQRSFYDHVLKGEESIIETAEYIVGNPIRAGIANDILDYPYCWHRWMDSVCST